MAWIFLFLSWHLNPKFLIRKTSERDILAPWQMIQTDLALLEITTSPNKSIHDSWYKHIIQQESATHADTLKVIPILYLPNFHKIGVIYKKLKIASLSFVKLCQFPFLRSIQMTYKIEELCVILHITESLCVHPTPRNVGHQDTNRALCLIESRYECKIHITIYRIFCHAQRVTFFMLQSRSISNSKGDNFRRSLKLLGHFGEIVEVLTRQWTALASERRLT